MCDGRMLRPELEIRNWFLHPIELKDSLEPSSLSIGNISSSELGNTCLLTRGRAWATSLTLRGTVSEDLLVGCGPGNSDEELENLLYSKSNSIGHVSPAIGS
ncbi:hypothetical protein GIB67_011217 [Kingdonia uniflora]|uniref:Uncharacterized protein n=1 Tax=Kingdonia uniflora TaxID=39325 RepID=A0A7J7M4B1_9MAGN|nr:hypothetical protein GIB67_011217 [Kingdonia uniflora]